MKNSKNVPKAFEGGYAGMIAITVDFCEKHLNHEYLELARYAVAGIHRKRATPLAGVVRKIRTSLSYGGGAPHYAAQRPHHSFSGAVVLEGGTDIERGFRVLKSDIEIAPVHHRLPPSRDIAAAMPCRAADRIRGHALICFLALTLYRVMRVRLKAKGHGASPKTALEILAKVQRFTTYIGEKPFTGTTRSHSRSNCPSSKP